MSGSSIGRLYARVVIIGIWSILVGGVCLVIWTRLSAAISAATPGTDGGLSSGTARGTSLPALSLAPLVAAILGGVYQSGVLGIAMGVGLMLVGVRLLHLSHPSTTTGKRL